jgi:hypothetical protein
VSNRDVSGAVIVVNSATLEDERNDGTVDRVVAEATKAVRKYDSDGVVPRHDVESLGEAVNTALELAAASAGRDLIVIVDDGDTRDDDTAAIRSTLLNGLDGDTMVVFAVVSNQPETVDKAFLDGLDDGHAKEKQIDVVYVGPESLSEVFGREVDEFLTGANA